MAAVRYNFATRAIWRIHKALFRLSGGRIGSRIAGQDAVFLTTTGWSSGEPRTVGLYYLEVPGTQPAVTAYAVIGSYAGEDRDPAWVKNLRAEPRALIQIGSRDSRVRGREAKGAERDELMGQFIATDDAYRVYRERTDRVLPIFVLEPEA